MSRGRGGRGELHFVRYGRDLPGRTQKTSVKVPPRSMAKLKAEAMVL